MKKEESIEELLNVARQEGNQYLSKLSDAEIPDEIRDFISDMDFHYDPNGKVHFRYLYWLYLHWCRKNSKKSRSKLEDLNKMLDKDAVLIMNYIERDRISRRRFSKIMGAFFSKHKHNKKLWYIGPKELFKFSNKERHQIRLLTEQYLWRKKHQAKLNESKIKRGLLERVPGNPHKLRKTEAYRQWLKLEKKLGKEMLPPFPHFRKIYTPKLNKNISTWITLLALLRKRRDGLINL